MKVISGKIDALSIENGPSSEKTCDSSELYTYVYAVTLIKTHSNI